MNERFQRVAALFEEARHLPPGTARAALLRGACDDELRAEVERLLRSHDAGTGLDARTGAELRGMHGLARDDGARF